MTFKPLNARELAQRIVERQYSSKWGDPRYTSTSLSSQEMRTLCEAVLADPTASLRRLKSRLARLYFVDTHPRREAFKVAINAAVSEWAKKEARRTEP